MPQIRPILPLILVLFITACTGPSPTPIPRDGYPARDIDVSQIPDAVPQYEPVRAAGNRSPYEQFGKTYYLLLTSEGYREKGMASWYGTKFHGRKTSNGETYDMFAMTAAHKTLPIPCYVQVTNLENQRSIIVRVNDRGPFHGDRIIDLSYAAAKKLGYSDRGTARVEVVALSPKPNQANSEKTPHIDELAMARSRDSDPLPGNAYLQAGAFRSKQSAEALQQKLAQISRYPALVKQAGRSGNSLFKVLVGPVRNNLEVVELRNLLEQAINLKPFLIYDY